MVNLREKKYAEAIDQLEQLPPDFNGYVFAQSQLALTAVSAAKEAKTDAERAAYQEKALRALRRIPTLPARADPATAQMFFAAQLEQGNLLYAAAAQLQKGDAAQADQKFAEMEKFTAQLLGQFQKMDTKLSAEVRAKLGFALNSLQRLARYGLASAEYRAGRYDKVLPLTADAVEAVKAQNKGDGPITLKDYKGTGGLPALDLRSKVEKGDEDQLKATVDNFSAFLDELAKQSDPKGMQRDIFFLANCYGSLGKHDRAAALYGQITPPQGNPGMKPDEKETATYWFIQLQRARELRLAKQFAEAREVLGRIPPPFRSLTVDQEERSQL